MRPPWIFMMTTIMQGMQKKKEQVNKILNIIYKKNTSIREKYSILIFILVNDDDDDGDFDQDDEGDDDDDGVDNEENDD